MTARRMGGGVGVMGAAESGRIDRMSEPNCCAQIAEELAVGAIQNHREFGWSVSDLSGNFTLEGIRFCPFCGTKLPENHP